uniref:NADH dehydrogenase subunit 4L n=1 Tax=Nocticola sp. JW1 9/1 TaxID=2093475 RepID=A0A2P1H9I0_9NEOP|nr:NADH dehydrogenase subunit 4L [Nocticola sp. JW1 9/1]
MILLLYGFLGGLWVFIFNSQYLLITLLGLEFMVLFTYFFLYYYMLIFGFNLFICLIYLTVSVCDGVLGLSLVVIMVRGWGNNCFSSYNLLSC